MQGTHLDFISVVLIGVSMQAGRSQYSVSTQPEDGQCAVSVQSVYSSVQCKAGTQSVQTACGQHTISAVSVQTVYSQCTDSVQSACNQHTDNSSYTLSINIQALSIKIQCADSVQSVYNQWACETVRSQCTVSVQSMHSQCTVIPSAHRSRGTTGVLTSLSSAPSSRSLPCCSACSACLASSLAASFFAPSCEYVAPDLWNTKECAMPWVPLKLRPFPHDIQ